MATKAIGRARSMSTTVYGAVDQYSIQYHLGRFNCYDRTGIAVCPPSNTKLMFDVEIINGVDTLVIKSEKTTTPLTIENDIDTIAVSVIASYEAEPYTIQSTLHPLVDEEAI